MHMYKKTNTKFQRQIQKLKDKYKNTKTNIKIPLRGKHQQFMSQKNQSQKFDGWPI